MKWNPDFRVLASSILIGALMSHAEAARSGKTAPQKIYLIEAEFRLHGTLLAAGRHPVYGMEERNIERPPGSPVDKTKLYQLSPLPIRYPSVTQNDNFSFNLFPSVPAEPCTLHVTLNLTDSTKAMAAWLGQGLPASWLRTEAKAIEDEIGAWTADLGGPRPEDFTVTVKRWGDGKAQAVLGSYHLNPDQPVGFDLALPAFPAAPASAAAEKYLFEMPGLRFWWQRQPPSRSDDVWPRGKPAAAMDPEGAAAKIPSSAPVKNPAPSKPAAKKRPFWKFWQRAD